MRHQSTSDYMNGGSSPIINSTMSSSQSSGKPSDIDNNNIVIEQPARAGTMTTEQKQRAPRLRGGCIVRHSSAVAVLSNYLYYSV